jgi:hypothetical protein
MGPTPSKRARRHPLSVSPTFCSASFARSDAGSASGGGGGSDSLSRSFTDVFAGGKGLLRSVIGELGGDSLIGCVL